LQETVIEICHKGDCARILKIWKNGNTVNFITESLNSQFYSNIPRAKLSTYQRFHNDQCLRFGQNRSLTYRRTVGKGIILNLDEFEKSSEYDLIIADEIDFSFYHPENYIRRDYNEEGGTYSEIKYINGKRCSCFVWYNIVQEFPTLESVEYFRDIDGKSICIKSMMFTPDGELISKDNGSNYLGDPLHFT
jgi:hypothetical protein